MSKSTTHSVPGKLVLLPSSSLDIYLDRVILFNAAFDSGCLALALHSTLTTADSKGSLLLEYRANATAYLNIKYKNILWSV